MPWSAQKLLSTDALSRLGHCPSQSTDDWRTIIGSLSYFLDGSLHSAIKKGDMEKVKQLLASGANPNEKRRQRTPLMVAAHRVNLHTVTLLLEMGAELETQDYQGTTTLMLAAGGWGYEGRDKDNKCLEVVKTLLERGADPNVCGKRGQTAMRYALGAANRRVMEFLSEHGASDYWYASVRKPSPSGGEASEGL
jgi:ankyrin repeat protein